MVAWKAGPLVALAMALTALAGCIGGDADVDGGTTAADPTDGPLSTDPNVTSAPPDGKKKTITQVEGDQAVFAPTWKAGQWWTYEASGFMHPGGTVTFAVISEDERGFYNLGADSEQELLFQDFHGGPFIPRDDEMGIQKDTLALVSNGIYQDYLGFDATVGSEWELELFDVKYTLTKEAVGPVATAKGSNQGIVVNGFSDTTNWTVEIEYAANAKWLNLFRITDDEGVVRLAYELSDFGSDGAPPVQRWDRAGTDYSNAQSPFYMLGMGNQPLESEGDAHRVYVVQRLEVGDFHGIQQAKAETYKPDGSVAASNQLTSGQSWFWSLHDDVQGYWVANVLAIGGDDAATRAKADNWIIRVQVEA